jgi:maltose/moltooligosaccharide transporter
MDKPTLHFWSIWNMCVGFLGIQFAWSLQLANMSPIYSYLGATNAQIPLLWLAAPLTGLIIQPIIGAMSDRTWCRLGRRKPYFLVGAILSSVALLLMPNSPTLWMAASLLWVLDASINISMEPFRALVADKLPDQQCSVGFALQGFFVGLGAVLASMLPWLLRHFWGFDVDHNTNVAIPTHIEITFYIGSAVFLLAVIWTVTKTKEYPPAGRAQYQKPRISEILTAIWLAFMNMPRVMKQVAIVQFFSWLGLFCMWLYFSNAVTDIFKATSPSDPLFTRGVEWAGMCYAIKDTVTFIVALFLAFISQKMCHRRLHGLCLLIGGLGLLSIGLITGEHEKLWLLLAMAGVGVAWASILSMPYTIIASVIPKDQVGVYMGIFNFFIVLPQIVCALSLGWIVTHLLKGNLIHAVMIGGMLMLIAAFLTRRIDEKITLV